MGAGCPDEKVAGVGLPVFRPPRRRQASRPFSLIGPRQHGSDDALSLMQMSPSLVFCQTLTGAGCPDEGPRKGR